MQRLNPLTFPLTGARLIEASAGTGKTYTIATLYVRLLLGHGVTATSGPLDVERILVVTFTEAATAELRERIRQRVREALQVFLLNRGDPLLLQLAAEFADQIPWAIRRLKLCLRQMDEAQIYTIHGFCNRLLQRHAFESGTAFDLRFETQDRRFREEAVRDFWRSRILPLDAFALEALAGIGLETPSKLERALRDWSRHDQLTLHQPPSLDLEGVLARLRSEVERVADLWWLARSELVPLLENLPFRKPTFKGADWAGVVSAFDSDPRQAVVTWAACLAPEHLRAHLHKRARTNGEEALANLDHPFLLACAGLAELAREPLRQALLISAWSRVRQRLAELKSLHQVLTPDDLLHKTAQALRGAGGEQLATHLRTQYPMVLIDEFQDTDPTQYFIFDRLFGRRTEGGLCMIGDPKQAIYAFRGGDIHTYIHAKRALQARDRAEDPHLFTLDVNWRATSGLVRAVNLLFQQVPEVFLSAAIPFHPVQASARADQAPLLIDAQQPCPLTLWLAPEDLPASNKQALQNALAEATAHQIVHGLNLAAAGRARLGDRPLRAGDMAVLVRNQQEGALIQQALGQQGIKSISIGRGSVFHAPEAVDLYQVLRAVAEPRDEQLIRAALGSSLFADSPLRLHERWADDRQWDALRLRFEHYHRLWMRAGLIPMLRLLLREQGVYARLAERQGWERRLADLFHLAELLQQAGQEVRGAQGLLRWFEEAISAADDQDDAQQVRLDQDDDLVQVVTIHKSKGLEYPLVFLPFAWSRRPAALALFHDDQADDRLTLDLAANSAYLARADQELLAEDLRLLYVALTRARHQVFLGIAPYQSARNGGLAGSALGHLVFQGEPPATLDSAQLRAALARWEAQAESAIQLADLPAPARFRAPVVNSRVARAETFRGYIPDDWRLASFSSLTQGADGRAQAPDADSDTDRDDAMPAEEEPAISIRDFPKGARAGTLMHELLEALDYQTLMPQRRGVHPDLAALVADQLKLHGYEQEPWTEVLCQWLQAVVRTPLEDGLSLAGLDRQSRVSEMEFHLPVGALNATALAEILRRNDPGREGLAPALAFDRVQGQLKGFIDLVCEHQGRYFVLDFKSNHLGPRVRDYHQAAMLEAVRRHQYDLQYLFYTVALHRLLRYRLGRAYRYDQHVGGVFCLFLRGMEPGREQRYGVFHQRPPAQLIARLDALLQGEQSQAPRPRGGRSPGAKSQGAKSQRAKSQGAKSQRTRSQGSKPSGPRGLGQTRQGRQRP